MCFTAHRQIQPCKSFNGISYKWVYKVLLLIKVGVNLLCSMNPYSSPLIYRRNDGKIEMQILSGDVMLNNELNFGSVVHLFMAVVDPRSYTQHSSTSFQ